MSEQDVRDRLNTLVARAVLGIEPRPEVVLHVKHDADDDDNLICWEIELSAIDQPVEAFCDRLRKLLNAERELGFSGEEFGDCCMAFTGEIDDGVYDC